MASNREGRGRLYEITAELVTRPNEQFGQLGPHTGTFHEKINGLAAHIGIQQIAAFGRQRHPVNAEIEHGAVTRLVSPPPPRKEPLAHTTELGRERLLQEIIIHEYDNVPLYGMNYYRLRARDNFVR